jgi:hypothetical protein
MRLSSFGQHANRGTLGKLDIYLLRRWIVNIMSVKKKNLLEWVFGKNIIGSL